MGFRDKFMAKSPFKAGHMSAAKAGNMKSPVNEGKESSPTQDGHSMAKAGKMDPMANMGNSMAKKADPYAEALKKDPKLPDYIKQRKGLEKGTTEYNTVQNKINRAYGKQTRPEQKVTLQQKTGQESTNNVKPAKPKKSTPVKPAEPKTKFEKRTDKKIKKAEGKGKTEKVAKIKARASQEGNTGLEKRLNYKGAKARARAAERKADKEQKKNDKEARKTVRETKDGVKTVKKFDKQGNLKKTKTKTSRKLRKLKDKKTEDALNKAGS